MRDILLLLQISVSIAVVILVLLQAKGTGIGSSFGGSSQVYRSRRGVEKFIVYLTVFFITLFFALSLLQVFASK